MKELAYRQGLIAINVVYVAIVVTAISIGASMYGCGLTGGSVADDPGGGAQFIAIGAAVHEVVAVHDELVVAHDEWTEVEKAARLLASKLLLEAVDAATGGD